VSRVDVSLCHVSMYVCTEKVSVCVRSVSSDDLNDHKTRIFRTLHSKQVRNLISSLCITRWAKTVVSMVRWQLHPKFCLENLKERARSKD
jgi:hypothetical protein